MSANDILRATVMVCQGHKFLKELIPGAYVNIESNTGYVFKNKHCENNCCSPKGALIVTLWIRESNYNRPKELERL